MKHKNKDEYIRLINKAKDYIELNLENKVTLKDIACHVVFSSFYLLN